MSGGESMGVLDLLAALAWLVAGFFFLAIAARARRRGSSARTWVVPGVGGILSTLWGIFILWWWSA